LTKKKLLEWQEAKEILDAAKENESKLRKGICEAILQDKVKGTKSVTKFGFKATAVATVNVKIDKEVLSGIFKELTAEEKACLRYKPELKAKEYQALTDESILHRAVTTSPGTSSLELNPIED